MSVDSDFLFTVYETLRSMKYLFFFLALLLPISTTLAQDFSADDNLEFTTKEDYHVNEGKILDMSTYILSHPIDEKDANQRIGTKVLIKWMMGTPDYQFAIDESIAPLSKKDE